MTDIVKDPLRVQEPASDDIGSDVSVGPWVHMITWDSVMAPRQDAIP